MASPAAILSIYVDAKTGTASAKLKALDAQLLGTAKTAEKAAATSSASMAAFGKRMTTVGGSMQKFGKTMTTHVGLPLVAIGAIAIKSAVDFNKSMTLISTQAGATAKEVDKLSKAVLAFASSGKTAFDPEELSEALYHIESVGFRGKKAMAVLRASSKLASVGNADLEATTYGLISAMKTGIKGTQNMTEAIGTLNSIVGRGDMRFEELTSSLRSGILVTGKQVGVTLSEVGAALDIMTEQGIPANNAATALNMGLLKMTSLSDKAKEVLGGIGIGAQTLAVTIRKEGLPAAIELLQDKLKGVSKVKANEILTEAFSVKSAKAIRTLIGAGEGLREKLHEITGGADEFKTKWQETQETEAFKLNANLAKLKAAMIELGNKLIPAVLPLLQRFARTFIKFVNFFTSLPKWTQDWIIKLSLAAIALGPIIGGLGTIIKLAGRATTALAGMGAAGAAGSAAEGGAAAGGAAAGGGALFAAEGGLTALGAVAIPVGLGLALAGLTKILMNTGSAFDDAHAKFEAAAKGLEDRSIPAWKRSREAVKALGDEMFAQKQNLSLAQTEARTPGLEGALMPNAASQASQVSADMKRAMEPVIEARGQFHEFIANIRLDQLAGLKALNADLKMGLELASNGWRHGTEGWRKAAVGAMQETVQAIRGGMAAGAIDAEKGRERIKAILAKIRLVEGTDPLGFAKGVQQGFVKAGAITQSGLESMIRRLNLMPKKSREVGQEAILRLAEGWAQGHPKLEHQVDVLRHNLSHTFGMTAKQLERRSLTLTEGMSTDFYGLAETVGSAGASIRETVDSMLRGLKLPSIDWGQIKQPFEGLFGGKRPKLERGEARGGLTAMVPGLGSGDHHMLSLDGSPIARVESREGIFVGNRNMMGALGAANAAVPRRAEGGPLPAIAGRAEGLMARAAKRFIAKLGGDKSFQAIVKNANRMDALHQPYLWGGGHGATASVNGPWDCSGAISELFNGAGWSFAPMVSGGFSSWGLPGKGKVSVLSNPEHVYAVIGNRAFGTSEENPGGGAGWINGYTYRGGFNVTHANLVNPMAAFHGGRRGKGQKAKRGLQRGGQVITGKVSYFGGGATAGGSNTSRPGMALNLDPGTESGWNNATTRKWREASLAGHPYYGRVTIAGKTANLPITDMGPAASTGRAIDITEGGVRKLGFSTSNFPTDSIGKVLILGSGGGGGGAGAGAAKAKGVTALGTNVQAGAEYVPTHMGKGIEEGISKTGKAVKVAGLKPSALPPSAAGLPAQFQKQLRAPGISYEEKLAIAGRAMEVAQQTETKTDDQAVRAYQRELYEQQATGKAKALAILERKIRKGGVKPATMEKWVNKAKELRSELGEAEAGITGIEGEEKTEAQEATERQTEATLELAETQKELAKELRETRELSEAAMATGSAVAWRALADKLSGNLGVRAIAKSRAASIGTVGSN